MMDPLRLDPTTAHSRSAVELRDEFVARQQGGESLNIDDYVSQYPIHADELRRLLNNLSSDPGSEPRAGDATEAYTPSEVPHPSPSSHAAPGPARIERLGDFRIVREIGRGGMGVVYEAEQESLSRRVALKVLLSGSFHDSMQLARFQREARAAARLHHTNIVPVFGVGEHERTHYYVMQYIPGRGLDSLLTELRWLAQHRREFDNLTQRAAKAPQEAAASDSTVTDWAQILLSGHQKLSDLTGGELAAAAPPGDSTLELSAKPVASPRLYEAHDANVARPYWGSVARIGAQVADALAYAHLQGVLHRDIKPANLLLDTAGTVWITDFGLAKAADHDNLTQTGDVVGTLRYMAPESFRGKNDARTDIYALGLTLYELLALRPAFDAGDRHSLIRQVTQGEIPSLRHACPAVPLDLETIVLKALERDPEHRYASAAEMAADLQHFLHDEPITARRATIPQRLARWYRHNPVVARLTIMLVVVFAAGFVGVTWNWYKSKLARDEAIVQKNDAINAREEAKLAEADARRAAKVSEAINRFLVDELLGSAAPEKARGRKLTVEEVLKNVEPRIEAALKDTPEVQASVHSTVGTTLYRLGEYDEAEPHLKRALELREAVLKKNHPDTLGALNNLAQLYKSQGRLNEAEPLYRKSYQARVETLGEKNPETLGALNNLGQLLQAQGKLGEAAELLERSYKLHREVLGPDEPDSLLAAASLASAWQMQGKTSEAEPLLKQSADKLAQKLGDDHPYTLTALHNLASLYQATGRSNEAEKLYSDVLTARRRVLGNEHPETLATLNQLATVLQDQGRLGEAEKLVEQLLAAALRVFGDNHPQTFVARHNLARLLQAEGKPEQAEPLVRANIEACKRVLGPEHPDTLQSMGNLAMILQAENKFDQAEPMLRDVLSMQRRVLGPDHMHTLVTMNNLAVALQAQGKMAEAEPLVKQNYDTCRKVLGAEHPDTLLAMSNLAQLYMSVGKWSEAEPLVREGYSLRRKTLGPEHPETLNAADDLLALLTNRGPMSQGEPLAREVLEIRRRTLGPEHPDTLKSADSLIVLLSNENKLAEVEKLLRETLAERSKKLGEQNAETLWALRNLAAVLMRQSQWKEAEDKLRAVAAARRAGPGADPAELVEALTMLGGMLVDQRRTGDAETILREAVDTGHKHLPEGSLNTAEAETLLGDCLTQLKKYAEAEPLLLESFPILQLQYGTRSPTRDAVARLVRLYEAWDKPEQAAEWKSKLPPAATSAPSGTKQPPPDAKPTGSSNKPAP